MIGSTPRESVTSDPTIEKSLGYLASRQKPSGAISGENEQYANYETSLAVSAFGTAKIGSFGPAQAKARDYVLSLQIQGDEKDVNYGGQPYEKEDPPYTSDLSNAQHAAQAAHDAGVTDAGFWSRLVKFLSRVQNRSESNDAVIHMKIDGGDKEVVSGNDGGAGYGPGKSQAGHDLRPDGKMQPRSYGSMTYALLKCLLFAGVKADDPRVKAAVDWLSRNFTVEKNPGFDEKDPKAAQQGYFYYCLTMARALAEFEKATGKPLFVTDAAGKPHEWRKELAQRLVSLEKPDGTWINEKAERWEEGNAVVATAYVVQALAICQGRLP
jgi:squalene-hopene/tetraprenyl-beta-curcumene cyclase